LGRGIKLYLEQKSMLRDREPMSLNHAHSLCPDLIRASTNLHKNLSEGEGLPDIGERKRRRPSDGYARQ
jgi:hypothetical protein